MSAHGGPVMIHLACALMLLAQASALGQSPPTSLAPRPSEINPRNFVRVLFPPIGPLELVQLDYGSSRITRSERGMLMDLNLHLLVRNRTAKPIEGLALAMSYGFGTPGAGGLNALSGIRLAPGETYAVPARMRVEIELPPASSRARPVDLPTSVRLGLDSVLFADGSAYGPDRMRVLSTMRINQAESARDRRFLQSLLETGGLALVVPAFEKWAGAVEATTPAFGQGTPRVLAGAAAERARDLAQQSYFGVVRFPGEPLEIVWARALLHESDLMDPAVGLRHRMGNAIRDFQVVWLLRDAAGVEFRAATISGSAGASKQRGLPLSPGDSLVWSDSAVLETRPRAAGPLQAGRVYLRAVEFADGKIWVPERGALEEAGLAGLLPPSPEMVRLLRSYRTGGMQAFLAELRR